MHCRAPDRLGEQPVEGRTIVKSPGDDDSSNFAGVADIGERIIVQEDEIPSRSPVTAQRKRLRLRRTAATLRPDADVITGNDLTGSRFFLKRMKEQGRVITAFLVAPAIIPVLVFAIALVEGVRVGESAVLASSYAAVTYSAAVAAGYPLFRLFTRKGWTASWQYLIAGALIGVSVLIAVSAAAEGVAVAVGTLLLFLGLGALSTLVFWVIAVKGSSIAVRLH